MTKLSILGKSLLRSPDFGRKIKIDPTETLTTPSPETAPNHYQPSCQNPESEVPLSCKEKSQNRGLRPGIDEILSMTPGFWMGPP